MRCSKCGFASQNDTAFKHVRRSFSTATRLLCVQCWRKGQQKLEARLLLVSLFVLPATAVLPLFVRRPTWVPANLVMVCLLMYATVLPHELGHVLGAMITRMKVLGVWFGAGRELCRWTVFGVAFHLHLIPSIGYVRAVPRFGISKRWQWFVVIAGGPAADVLMLVSAVLINGSQRWFGMGWDSGPVFWQALAVSSVLRHREEIT